MQQKYSRGSEISGKKKERKKTEKENATIPQLFQVHLLHVVWLEMLRVNINNNKNKNIKNKDNHCHHHNHFFVSQGKLAKRVY